MKKLAIGEDDFKILRQNDNYFVDKSLFVKEVIDDASRVLLFPRPRRFGKTLNMSMLQYFGFTQFELDTMLENYALNDMQDEEETWYNGYCFGSIEISTSANTLLHSLIKDSLS